MNLDLQTLETIFSTYGNIAGQESIFGDATVSIRHHSISKLACIQYIFCGDIKPGLDLFCIVKNCKI